VLVAQGLDSGLPIVARVGQRQNIMATAHHLGCKMKELTGKILMNEKNFHARMPFG
jgi:hypothetical protein